MKHPNYHYHLQEILKPNRQPIVWSQLIIAALATCCPLFVGWYNGHLAIAIYGALTGYLLTISDYQGSIPHKFKVTVTTFLLLIGGFLLGTYLSSNHFSFFILLAGVSYWVGLMAEEGAELERALLFASFQLIVGAYTPQLSSESAHQVFEYALMGYIFALLSIMTHAVWTRKKTDAVMRFRDALRRPLKSKREKHFHALSYMTIAMILTALVSYHDVYRGYWAIITALIVMKPDRRQSLYRGTQRLLGTCLGVGVADIIIYYFHTPLILLCIITLCAFWGPWALKRNYLLSSFIVSVMILLLLDLPYVETGDLQSPMRRLEMTALGCLFGVVGVFIAKLLNMSFKRKVASEAETPK